MNLTKFRTFIKNSFGQNDLKNLFINFSNYGSYQTITYLAHLITIPYLVRIIGQANFGIISVALAFVSYMAIITDFGFTISGVQYIAQNQYDQQKRTEIISNIFALQIVLMICSFIFMFILVNVIQKFQLYKEIFYYTFLLIPANILIAIWFYIGMERIKYLNLLNILSKTIYVILIFLLVKKPDDFFYVPLIYGMASGIAGICSLYVIITKFKVHPFFLKSIKLLMYIKNNWNIFFSILAINLYRNSNIVILGLIAEESQVGIYSGGEKIVMIIQSIFAPLTQVLYPYISRLKVMNPQHSKKILRMTIIFLGIVTVIISLFLFIFADKIAIIILGMQFARSGTVIRIASFVIFFGTLNYMLGVVFMTNYGMKKEFSQAVTIVGVTNVFSCLILSGYWQEIGAAISLLSSESFLTTILLYLIYHKYRFSYKYLFSDKGLL